MEPMHHVVPGSPNLPPAMNQGGGQGGFPMTFNRAALSPGSGSMPRHMQHFVAPVGDGAVPAAIYPPQMYTAAQAPQVFGPPAQGLIVPPVGGVVSPLVQDDASPRIRRCTDRGWLVIFSLAALASLAIATHGLISGVPARLGKLANFKGEVCGVDLHVKAQPFLYVPLDPVEGSDLHGMFAKPILALHDGRCVTSCPTADDVAAKVSIPMTKRVVRNQPSSAAALLVEFDVATPAYATEPAANSFCLPIDPRLQAQLLSFFSGTGTEIAFGIASIKNAWPVIMTQSTLALFVSFGLVWVTRQVPLLVAHLAPIGASISLLLGGGFCFLRNNKEHPAVVLRNAMFSANYTWSILLGVFMVIAALGILFVHAKSPMGRARSARVLDMCSEVFGDSLNLVVAPVLSSGVVYGFAWFWLVVFVHLCGLSNTGSVPTSSMTGAGEGSLAWLSPLHQVAYLPWSSLFAVIFWMGIFLWTLHIIVTVSNFAVSYTGTIWYFASPEGSEEKEAGWCPTLVAFSLGLANHFGSFALSGLVMLLTGPIRALGGWAAMKNDYSSDDSTVIISSILLPLKAPIRSIVDCVTPAGFVEMAISSTEFWTSMEISSRRLGLPASPSARLASSLDFPMRCLSLCVAVPFAFGAYSIVADPKSRFLAPSSTTFAGSPLTVGLMTFALSYTFASLFSSMWTCLCDSLMYSYLVESSAPSGEVDENPTEKVHATSYLRDLIVETTDEFTY